MRRLAPWVGLAALLVLAVLLPLGLLQGSGTDGGGPERGAGQERRLTPSLPEASATPGEVDPDSGLRWVALNDLPPEAAETLARIESGGPFPYDQDDGTFFNREGILPDRPEGYYREYTVETPGSDDRGARRIVAGEPGEYYWTADHYASFERIGR